MTKEEIIDYEYCKNHNEFIKLCIKNLQFSEDKYGFNSSMPKIENKLEHIHKEMYKKVITAMYDAKDEVQKIIDSI